MITKRLNNLVLALFFLALVFPAGWVSGQTRTNTISGTVRDSITQIPIENVNIIVAGSTGGTTTNKAGEFILNDVRYPALLYFSHLGYAIQSTYLSKRSNKPLSILLSQERKILDEISIRGNKIQKVITEDTLIILDYELIEDGLLLIGSPFKFNRQINLYLTDPQGNPKFYKPLKQAGKLIKYPEIRTPLLTFLFKDFTGNIRLLSKNEVLEINYTSDSISLNYPESYTDFLQFVLPMKCEMAGALYYQVSTQTKNVTMWLENAYAGSKMLKTVIDPFGMGRYINFGTKDFHKYVAAPIYRINNHIAIFDFFDNNIEFFDREGKSVKSVPMTFQNKTRSEFLGPDYQDIDQYNFTQQVVFDRQTQKAYAFFRLRKSGVQTLREIDLNTGKIVRIIEIPDLPNISKLQVHDNTLYFMYDLKVYPYNRTLYRMAL
jgi:hypothetical protein